MAMFPNATRGYMPFVTGQAQKRHHGQSSKPKTENSLKQNGRRRKKTYQVTLRDRNGVTYTYIVQTDGTKSMPVLSDAVNNRDGLKGLTGTTSLPDIGRRSKTDCLENSKKEGLLAAFLRFLSGKKSKSKSKRKQKPMVQRKRQRTVSMMSNLDPIQESPDEDDYENEDDNDSYTHETISVAGSDGCENVSFHSVNDNDESEDEDSEEEEIDVKVEP